MRDQRKFTLRNQSDFNKVYKRGSSKGSQYTVVLYKKNQFEYNRVAFVASKKVGNSVERNRARRLMRESFRVLKEELRLGYDVIFVARRNILNSGQNEVEASMKRALINCGLIEKKSGINKRNG